MSKKLLFILVGAFCLTAGSATAQFSRPISIGAGAGATFSMVDLKNSTSKVAFYGEADYLVNPFISIGIHGEKGGLKGDAEKSTFENSYFAGNVNGKIRLGQFMNQSGSDNGQVKQGNIFSRLVSNVYVGAGAGFIKNNIEYDLATKYVNGINRLGGKISSEKNQMNFIVPLNIGVDIPFVNSLYGPKLAININYQHTITATDNLDGVINNKNDQYGLLSLGVKYALFDRK
ncbi:outer membrane beta-barrel protein [Sphingobacterium kitahiroshimense]|uniref:outer membrane beta-barrel protein n=1 Tax=Sphingobacterium kitahiroshimense TaxID=470446 RepID=UPI0032098F56